MPTGFARRRISGAVWSCGRNAQRVVVGAELHEVSLALIGRERAQERGNGGGDRVGRRGGVIVAVLRENRHGIFYAERLRLAMFCRVRVI